MRKRQKKPGKVGNCSGSLEKQAEKSKIEEDNRKGLTREERKRLKELRALKAEQQKKKVPYTAQDTIPYKEIYRDGICVTEDKLYSKTVQFFDINYQLAQNDDKTTIFENYCEFLNYFDSSVQVQVSFLNQQVNFEEYAKTIDIPPKGDSFDDIRKEYADMLKAQLAKGNNGLVKTKYITFSIKADSLKIAKARLERIETDVLNNFKAMGAVARPVNGVGRLKILHDVMNMDTKEPFRFHYGMVAQTGLGTKDFIAPTGFDFRNDSYFRMGQTFACVSYLQITSPELTDKMLADFLDMEENLIVRQKRISQPTNITDEIVKAAFELFKKHYRWEHPIRSLGVRGSDLVMEDIPVQLDLFDNQEKREKLERLDRAVDEIRRRFGYFSIQRAAMYQDKVLSHLDAGTHTVHPHSYFHG